jgi:hypothetical protein
MKVFTLYVGTTQPEAKNTVVKLISERFGSFTVISGEGYYHGQFEPMWFVRIATDKPMLVVETADALRSTLNQEVVGIEYESRYYKCTPEDAATALRIILQEAV